MIRLRLRRLVETGDSLEVGPEVGELVLTEEFADVLVGDDDLRARLEELLSEPLAVRAGDPSGRSFATHLEAVGPAHPAYLSLLLERLERRDLRLAGEIVEG